MRERGKRGREWGGNGSEGGREGGRKGGGCIRNMGMNRVQQYSQTSFLSHLNLGGHGHSIEGVDVCLAASATEEQLGERGLLVLWEMREEQLEELTGKVEYLDCGRGYDGAMTRHLTEEGGFEFENPRRVCRERGEREEGGGRGLVITVEPSSSRSTADKLMAAYIVISPSQALMGES